jgi:hypothetical protein
MAEKTISPEKSPHTESLAKPELSTATIDVENALTQALPIPDITYGGAMLVVVIMFHAIWIRFITGAVLKRFELSRSLVSMWRIDLVFVTATAALLGLHLAEVLLWTSALIFGGIVGGWDKAGYFAGNCYTALGEPFSLPHAWRMLPPIIAISGIFTFAWTASVLVDIVSRYNTLRADILAEHRSHQGAGKRSA